MKIFLGILLVSIVNYFVIMTVVDIFLLGKLSFRFFQKCPYKKYVITKENPIDIQTGYECSGFSTAYVLRHWNEQADGSEIYRIMPNKMKNGYVYPKGIQRLLQNYGYNVKYCKGNLNSLKRQISKGNPVIVLMRVRKDKNWLHYVPVVGYDEKYIFIAESLPELINCDCKFYNRRVDNKEFLRLWNTAMIEQPFYKNTYMVIEKPFIT